MCLLLFASALLLMPGNQHVEDLKSRAAEALKDDPAQAATLYQQCVEREPDWAECWFYLGVTRFQTRQYAPARDALHKAVALDPQHGTIWAFLGLTEERLSQDRQAFLDLKTGEAQGLADDPAFVATVRQTAASLCLKAHAYSDAVEQLQPLAQAGDHTPLTVELLGKSALGQNDATEATEPAGETAWQLYANHPDKAERLSQDLVAKYPRHIGVHYLRGICLLRKDADQANHEFQAELKLAPASAIARLQIAISDLRLHRPAEAATLAAEACHLEPANPLAHLVWGRALFDQSKAAAAIPEFQTAMHLDARNAQVHFYLARAYHALGRETDAAREKAAFEQLNANTNRSLPALSPP